MNKHINKNRIAPTLSTTLERVDRDHIPKSVATDMLCTQRLTNPERKRLQSARAELYQSTLTQKPVEELVAGRMHKATWTQLQKWLKRMSVRRADAQRHVSRLTRYLQKLNTDVKPDPRKVFMVQRALADAQLKGAAFEQGRDAVEDEIERRQKFWKELKKVAPSVAAAIENK